MCMKCWHVRPQRRPSFADLSDILTEMLNDTKVTGCLSFYWHFAIENRSVQAHFHFRIWNIVCELFVPSLHPNSDTLLNFLIWKGNNPISA